MASVLQAVKTLVNTVNGASQSNPASPARTKPQEEAAPPAPSLEIEILFPTTLNQKNGRTDIKEFLSTATPTTFRSFLVNQKKEHLLVCMNSAYIEHHLSSIGIKPSALEDESAPLCAKYLRWKVFFLDAMNDPTRSAKDLQASIQPNNSEASWYLDRDLGYFFGLLPFDVHTSSESKQGGNTHRFGLQLYYDLDLVREHVFKYQEAESLASYIIEVQSKAKPKMAENLAYETRSVEVYNPVSIYAHHYKVASEVYLRVDFKNELHDLTVEKLNPEKSIILRKYLKVDEGVPISKFVTLGGFQQKVHSLQLKLESSMLQGTDARIPDEYLSFLDCQLVNDSKSSELMPAEHFTILFKITRRELLKFKKNKKLLYLESPVVRQLRENVDNLLLVETTNTPQITQTGETSTTSASKKSILDGLDKESQKQLSKSIMSLKVQTAMGAQKKSGPKLLDDEEPAANTFKKDQGAPALPPGSLEAFFENYNSNFLTPLNFRVTYPDGMSTDYATDIKWQLLCKDVLVAKVSLDRTDIAEGEELDITFSFKSYFTNEVLLVVDESSLVFNCEDIYNKVKPNGKEPPTEDILLYETEDISQDGARIGVVTPRREALKIGINSGQKKTIKIRCTAVKSGYCSLKQLKVNVHDMTGLFLTQTLYSADFSFEVLSRRKSDK